MKGMSPIFTFGVVCLAVMNDAAAQSEARGPAVVLEFEGDQAAVSIAKVVESLSARFGEQLVPMQEVVVEQGEGLCNVYERAGLPTAGCTEAVAEALGDLTRRTNEGFDPQHLSPGQSIRVPRIDFNAQEQTFRSFDSDQPMTLQRYETRLSVPSENAAIEGLFEEVYKSGGANTSIHIEGGAAAPKQLYSSSPYIPPQAYVERCASGSNGSTSPTQGAYWYMLDWLADTGWTPPPEVEDCLLRCQSTEGVRDPGCPDVILVDSAVKPHSDLTNGVTWLDAEGLPSRTAGTSATAEEQCEVDSRLEDGDHGTHLAGIIASRDDKVGMIGVHPGAQLESFDWSHAKMAQVRDLLRARQEGPYVASNGPQLFVFASKFPSPADELVPAAHNETTPSYLPTIIKGGKLSNEDLGEDVQSSNIRLAHHFLAKEIARIDWIPWIVAAGQYDEQEPEDVDELLPFTPQNLGDMQNVITVTSCGENCSGTSASIWRRARYDTDRLFVHVAAPGFEVPGLIGNDGYAMATGTSQATAFVAGIVSAMLSCHKEFYYDANTDRVETARLKRRLQYTSNPVFWRDEDLQRLAAGVVDPEVALLDPAKSWYRKPDALRTGDEERYVEIQPTHWCVDHLTVQDDTGDNLAPPATKNLLRIVENTTSHLADAAVGRRVWVAYSQFWERPGAVGNASDVRLDFDKVTRWDPRFITKPGPTDPLIQLQNGEALTLNQIDDLILSKPLPSGSCSSQG